MKKFLSKFGFWVLQISGCAMGVGVVFLVVGVSGSITEKFLFFLVAFLGLFIPTTCLRFLYKRFVRTDPFHLIDFVKLIVILSVVVVFMKELPYYMGYFAGIVADFVGIDKKLEIDINPPKKTGVWQYVGMVIICTGWTVFYFVGKELRRHSNARIERFKLKDDIRQAQLNTLKGHLNPKYIVSSLKMIKEKMLVDVSVSRALLTKMSEILRYSLTKNNINSVSLEEELHIVKNYVDLLDIKDTERFSIIYNLSADTLKSDVPPMLLTSLMEMATTHGILKLKEGGKVVLSSELSEEKLRIKVVQSGKISRSEETGIIEKTINQRLKLLFEDGAELRLSHELNDTTLIVDMPIRDQQ